MSKTERTKEKESKRVETDVTFTGMSDTFQDISVSQKKTEAYLDMESLQQAYAQVHHSRAQFMALFENAPVGYVVLDPQLKILEANIGARRMLYVKDNSSSIQKNFLSFVTKGINAFIEWVHSLPIGGLEIELYSPNREGEVKVFCSQYEKQGKHLYFLTLISVSEEYRLRKSLKLFKLVYENTQEGIFITDPQFNITHVNPAFTKITGYLLEDVKGKNPKTFCTTEEGVAQYQEMNGFIAENGFWKSVVYHKNKDGRVYPQQLTVAPVYVNDDHNASILHYIGIVEDIEEQLNKELQLHALAELDPLTGLFSRQGFNVHFQNMFSEAQREGDQLALMFIDLDNFKYINDHYGHDYGDELLKSLALRLKNGLKHNDIIARLGGDEFVVVMKGNFLTVTLENIAKKMISLLAQPYSLFDIQHVCSASIGIAVYPDDSLSEEDLLKAADSAMYSAKEAGRNQYHLFNKEQHSLKLKQESLLADIADGLQNREFVLYYQGQHDMRTGDLVGFEGLVRWHRSDKDIRTPGQFLPAIEDDKLMIRLGKQLIDQVFLHVSAWRQAGLRWPVSINLAAIQLRDESTVKKLELLSEQYPEILGLIHLEITETTIFENDHLVSSNINRLHDFGFTMVLDDFGTGYSSIYSLKKFKFKVIKIDKSFVDDILDSGSNNTVILNAMIRLIQELGLDIVCEGIEKQEQVDYLLSKQCNVAQGYFYHKPMPKQKMLHYIQDYL